MTPWAHLAPKVHLRVKVKYGKCHFLSTLRFPEIDGFGFEISGLWRFLLESLISFWKTHDFLEIIVQFFDFPLKTPGFLYAVLRNVARSQRLYSVSSEQFYAWLGFIVARTAFSLHSASVTKRKHTADCNKLLLDLCPTPFSLGAHRVFFALCYPTLRKSFILFQSASNSCMPDSVLSWRPP